MEKEIIIDGVDVSKCPHINAYFPDSPKCQQGMGVGGCGSECRGKCSYVDKLKIHNEIQQLKEENEELKRKYQESLNIQKQLQEWQDEDLRQIKELKTENEELIERANAYNGMKILANCRLEKLEKIEEVINTTCFDYAGIDMVYFRNELLQIIRGEE